MMKQLYLLGKNVFNQLGNGFKEEVYLMMNFYGRLFTTPITTTMTAPSRTISSNLARTNLFTTNYTNCTNLGCARCFIYNESH